MKTKECTICNKQVDSAAKFCPECGAAFSVQGAPTKTAKGKKPSTRDTLIVIGVVLLISSGYFIFSNPEPVPKPRGEQISSVPGHENMGEMGGAIENLPTDYDGLVMAGDQFMNQNNFPLAAECYKRALAMDPNSPDVRSDFASCLYGMGLAERALEEFRRVRNEYPLHSVSLFNLGVVFYGQERDDSAKFYFTKYLELDPQGKAAEQARTFLNELGI